MSKNDDAANTDNNDAAEKAAADFLADQERAKAEAEASLMTEKSVADEIVACGSPPNTDKVQNILDQIAIVPDGGLRLKLFIAAKSKLKGDYKQLVTQAQSQAKKDWTERLKSAPGSEQAGKHEAATSELPLPYWGRKYLKHNNRAFVFGRPRDDAEYDVPLHSPLRIRSSVTFPDRTVQAREPMQGVVIEFEDRNGQLCSLAFQQSHALSPTTNKEGMVQDLVNAGVGFTHIGIEKFREGVLASGDFGQGGAVYDYPGWRGKDFFLTPGGRVIGKTNLDVSLARPLSGFRETGTLNAWREAVAPVFCEEVIQKAPHVPATLLFGLVSPLVELAQEEMSLILSLAGRTTRLKTYSLRLNASIWGVTQSKENGEKGLEGTVVTFNATANKLEQFAAERSGAGMGNDDTTLMDAEKLGLYLYRLATGDMRGRLHEKGSGWSIAVAITSEVPIVQYIRSGGGEPHPGLMARVVEIPIQDNRVSDEPVNKMAAAFENYGHAGPAFIEAMLAGGWDRKKISAAIKDRLAKMLGGTGEREQSRRAARGVAFIGLAGQIAQEAKLIPATFDVDAYVLALWDMVKAGADTSNTEVNKIIHSLAGGLRDGSIPIHTDTGIAPATVEGSGAICVMNFRRDQEPVFVLTGPALASIIGNRVTPTDAAKSLDDAGALYRQQKDRLTWKSGEAGVGAVTAYVIYARAVLGPEYESMILEQWAARRGSRPKLESIPVVPLTREA